MGKVLRTLGVAGLLSLQLLMTGCNASGGLSGLFGLFGLLGGGSSDDVVQTLASEGSDGGTGGENDLIGSNGHESSSDIVPTVAVLHNPEPGSLALFGGGMAGLAMWRRRRVRKPSK